jgi:3-isopropylmalate dehydrogenase
MRAAAARAGRLTVVSKLGGIPTIGALWRDRADAADAGGVEVEHLEVDNVCYQVIADPGRFDVLVTPNMLGDIVADTAAIVLGSRGMALSANFGDRDWGVYQTGHGSAHDLAGTDTANPVGQIHSLAMLLRESFGWDDAADTVERAVREVLGGGVRTADIAGPDSVVVSTAAMGDAIAARVRSLAREVA